MPLLGHRPSEHLLDRLNQPIDVLSTVGGFGQPLLDSLQGQRAKILGRSVPMVSRSSLMTEGTRQIAPRDPPGLIR